MNAKIEQLEVNGVKYVRADQVAGALPNGNRAVVVVDRGWIFAGDVSEKDGRIYLDRAVHVQGWDAIGFDGMLAAPKGGKVRIKKLTTRVDMPADAELFRAPVADDWGL